MHSGIVLLLTLAICSVTANQRAGQIGGNGVVISSGNAVGEGASATTFQRPGFCRQYECPAFTERMSNTTGHGHTIRTYVRSTTWAATSVLIPDFDASSFNNVNLTRYHRRAMFSKLYRYIRGANAENAAYSMTLPVIKKFSLSQSDRVLKVTMMFYLTTPIPATPTDDDVTLVTLPAGAFYVRGFRSYTKDATPSDIARNLNNLQTSIPQTQAGNLNDNVYYTAGYGPRYSLTRVPRYDEVLLKVQPEAQNHAATAA